MQIEIEEHSLTVIIVKKIDQYYYPNVVNKAVRITCPKFLNRNLAKQTS